MKDVLEGIYWVVCVAGLLYLGACPAAGRVFESRLEYLESPEGQAHVQEEIEYKIFERYGSEALIAYQEGEAVFPSAVSDVVMSDMYGLPILAFLLVATIGLVLISWGAEQIFAEQEETSNDASDST